MFGLAVTGEKGVENRCLCIEQVPVRDRVVCGRGGVGERVHNDWQCRGAQDHGEPIPQWVQLRGAVWRAAGRADGVDFVCISMCDGAQTYNIHHTHAVHLQYPCGVHTCAMRLDKGTLDEQGRVDVAHGCPVEAGKETSMQTRPSGLCRGWST